MIDFYFGDGGEGVGDWLDPFTWPQDILCRLTRSTYSREQTCCMCEPGFEPLVLHTNVQERNRRMRRIMAMLERFWFASMRSEVTAKRSQDHFDNRFHHAYQATRRLRFSPTGKFLSNLFSFLCIISLLCNLNASNSVKNLAFIWISVHFALCWTVELWRTDYPFVNSLAHSTSWYFRTGSYFPSPALFSLLTLKLSSNRFWCMQCHTASSDYMHELCHKWSDQRSRIRRASFQ